MCACELIYGFEKNLLSLKRHRVGLVFFSQSFVALFLLFGWGGLKKIVYFLVFPLEIGVHLFLGVFVCVFTSEYRSFLIDMCHRQIFSSTLSTYYRSKSLFLPYVNIVFFFRIILCRLSCIQYFLSCSNITSNWLSLRRK